MNFKRYLICSTFAMAGLGHAEKLPDPIEFVTGMVSLAELCAARYEGMNSAPQRLLEGMTASERADVESIKSAPQFAAAWKHAREGVAKLPDAKVLMECQSIMAIKPRAK